MAIELHIEYIVSFTLSFSVSIWCSVAGVVAVAAVATSHQNRLYISHKLSFVSHSFIGMLVAITFVAFLRITKPKMNIYVEPRKIATTPVAAAAHADTHTHIV